MKCPKCHSENSETKPFCGDCGTRLTSPEHAQPVFTKTLETPREEFATGFLFAGRYQIIEELGKGGMGKVYRVLDKKLQEEVALKLIRPEIASDDRTLERFKSELKLARKISQKNVGRMFDMGEETGTHYITMEYVPGEDLKSSIRRFGRLPIGKCISIAKQICDGLSEAHAIGIVHRDLKPSNIMIDKEGNVRIMDFGIARSLKEKGLTGAGLMIGTPEYMSPEQVEGKEADQRSDIYSLGIVLYEMLTGRAPFEGETPLSIAVKQKVEKPRDPKELNDQITDDLGRLVLRCLEKDRSKRYESTEQVGRELENMAKDLLTTAHGIPKTKPHTSKEITITLGSRKLLFPALLVIAMALIGLFLWHPWSARSRSSLPPADKPSIAVVYFENNTGDEKLDHWRKGIADLLITDLTQSRYLKVLGGDRLFDILNRMGQLEAKGYSSEVLRAVAAQAGVNHVARGSYSKAGDTYRIDMVLQDARSGEPIATQRVEGKGEEGIFAMVDALTRWTKTSMKLTSEQLASDLDKTIGTITTSSPEAYEFYVEGNALFNKLKYQQSIECLEKAIALDPGFAMAFRKMATAYGNMGKSDERTMYLQKALELSDRLSEKERLLIQGSILQTSDSTLDKAIEAYTKLIDLYPDHPEAINANNNLGAICMSMEDWDNAIEHNEAAAKAGSKFPPLYSNLARSYMAKGDSAKAEKVLEDAISGFPDNQLGHWDLARLYAFQGRFDLALKEVDKAAAIDPTLTKARFYHLMWDFPKAEEEYKKWLGLASKVDNFIARPMLESLYRTQGKFEEAKNQLSLGIDFIGKSGLPPGYLFILYYYVAYHDLKSGRYEEALGALEKAKAAVGQDIVAEIGILELEGWIYAQMGKLDEARKTAEVIKDMVEASPYKKRIRHYHFVTGMIQLKRDDYSGAVEHFKIAVSLWPHPMEWGPDDPLHRFFLALAYCDSGDLQAARDEFEGLVAYIPGRTAWGDLYALSYYRLGGIYEKQGNTAKAIERYGQFIDLWKDADPGLPEVADARKRLARLKGS